MQIAKIKENFDRTINNIPNSDVEFWYARELMPLLGYETLESFGFHPKHSPYYGVFLFDNTYEIPFSKTPDLKNKINTYRARIRPLEDFMEMCD